MGWQGRFLQLSRLTVGTAIVVSFVLLVTVQQRQRIFHREAVALLTDVQSLEYRKSDWVEAQMLMRKWGADGRYEGICGPESCTYEIRLGTAPPSLYNVLPYFNRVVGEDGWDYTNSRYQIAYASLGGRFAGVSAEFIVEDGLIQRKSFGASVDVPAGTYKPAQTGVPGDYSGAYVLMGRVSSQGSLVGALGGGPQLLNHPDYKIGSPSGCTNCISINVAYVPGADAAMARRLMGFDLGCFVGTVHCFSEKDLLPFAGSVHERDLSEQSHDLADQSPPVCGFSPRQQARDSTSVMVVEALKDTPHNAGAVASSGLRLVEVMKGGDAAAKGAKLDVQIAGYLSSTGVFHPSVEFHKGLGYILFQRGPTSRGTSFVLVDECGAVQDSAEALASVVRGVDESSSLRTKELRSWGWVDF